MGANRSADTCSNAAHGLDSWDSYGLSVTQDEFKANADYMAQYLRRYGWEYAVVDEGKWNVDNYGIKANAAGLFNLTGAPQTVVYLLQSIFMSRTSGAIRNLWEHKDLGATDVLKAQLPPHASALFQVRP